MKTPALFKEYVWLVNTIYKAGKISLAEINEKWRKTEMSEGVEYARATFNRHKDAIQDIFGLYIECDRKDGNRYYIGNARVLEGNSVQKWMLSTLSVSNVLADGLAVQDKIVIESIPDDRHLAVFIEAMKECNRVEIEYRRFGAEDTKTYTFDPYALKTYQQRWYILGHFVRKLREDDDITDVTINDDGDVEYFLTFSFDRIEKVTLLKKKFKMNPKFDAREFFNDCYGVSQGDYVPAQRIVIRAFGDEAYRIRTLPFHVSQHEIATYDDCADFEYFFKPTYEFTGKLLSRGAWLQVLEPEWLAEEVRDMHRETVRLYDTIHT